MGRRCSPAWLHQASRSTQPAITTEITKHEIICSSATIVSKTYILDDVQIVNGLQTSHTIYEVLRGDGNKDFSAAQRSLLIRILATQDPAVRDRVIRATNRQTTVPVASLRATDEIQRKIESYFLANGWFYDRRKNYYRNIGKSPERIISIPLLAQAVMAIGLSEPSNSRARPSSLLKRNEDYRRVFSEEVGLHTYLWIGKTQKRVDSFLTAETSVTASERTNLRFHASMLIVARRFGGRVYSPAQLAPLAEADESFTDDDIRLILVDLRSWVKEYSKISDFALDRIAKSKEFATFVLDRALSNSPIA
jgi:hypothetical protein